MIQTSEILTLEEFLASPQGDGRYELIDGVAIAKMSPKRFHSRTQRACLHRLEDWGQERGEIGLEWSIRLKRQGRDWVPVPDLLFVSHKRLPPHPLGDEACPIPPDLAIEIVSPGQTFGDLAEKAADYLAAGVLRVWVVDPSARSITVFAPNAVPITYRGNRVLSDPLLPDLEFTPQEIFAQAGLP